MRQYDLFAIGTKFKPPQRIWSGKLRRCNATYLPKHEQRRPTKLDYCLVANRWKSSVDNCCVKWGTSLHRFGKKFDHELLSTTWSWRIRTEKTTPPPDYKAMTAEMWADFDTALREHLIAGEGDMAVEVTETNMEKHLDRLTEGFTHAIATKIPKKQKIKFDGREASTRTKALYDQRIRDYSSGREIKKSDRKAWNSVLSKACKQDYHDWLQRWIRKIEQADVSGDTKAISQGVNVISGSSKQGFSKKPRTYCSGDRQGETISGPEELGELWRAFLEGKFSQTELEQARAEYEDIGPNLLDDTDDLTIAEFMDAVSKMKNDKATGPDNIPAEVFKNSELARNELFFFLRQVWRHECVPKNLVLCLFVMIYKRKVSSNDPSCYRIIGLLNHAYKLLSICLLKRIVSETEWSLSDWQNGFRQDRGCRDNILLLRVIYDNIIANNKQCVITYIDFAAAFDSVSHRFLDSALGRAGATRKTRALFRTIYAATQGTARVQGEDGKISMSQTFTVRRGVIQGDVMSPVLFILALDQLIQQVDTEGQGVKVGTINELRVLGYADDAAMMAPNVEQMTARLTKFADASKVRADMELKMSKTFSHHVRRQDKVTKATPTEIKAKEQTYKFPCLFCEDGCDARFKTEEGMLRHATTCDFNYGVTSNYFEVEKIKAVFGKSQRKLFLVSWKGYGEEEDSWVTEHSLMRDGCKESIDDFWLRTGINPSQDFFVDPEGRPRCWMCGYACKNPDPRFLKCHITTKKHN